MASFKDLIVNGVGRFVGKVYAPNGIVGNVTGVADNVKAGGTSGQVLTSNGTSAPTWKNVPSDFTAQQVTDLKTLLGLGIKAY